MRQVKLTSAHVGQNGTVVYVDASPKKVWLHIPGSSRRTKGRKMFFYGQYDIEAIVRLLSTCVVVNKKYVVDYTIPDLVVYSKAYTKKSYNSAGNKVVAYATRAVLG